MTFPSISKLITGRMSGNQAVLMKQLSLLSPLAYSLLNLANLSHWYLLSRLWPKNVTLAKSWKSAYFGKSKPISKSKPLWPKKAYSVSNSLILKVSHFPKSKPFSAKSAYFQKLAYSFVFSWKKYWRKAHSFVNGLLSREGHFLKLSHFLLKRLSLTETAYF